MDEMVFTGHGDSNPSGEKPLVVGGELVCRMNRLVAVLTKQSSVFHTEDESRLLLAYITSRKFGRKTLKKKPLMFACQFIGCVYFKITL